MTDFFTTAWEFIAKLPTALGWTVIGGLATALIAGIVSIWNTKRSLEVQRLTNVRSASTFIADKRQKWIDDLRTDASKYLSLSLETSEAWKQLYRVCGNEYDEHWDFDPQNVLKVCESLRIKFLNQNATRDSEHHQLYMRIILRLNNDEAAHQKLITSLDELRTHMSDLATAALTGSYSNQKLFDSIALTLESTAAYTKIILKEEWQRLKREIADPDRLIREILTSSRPQLVSIGTMQRKPESGVASSLSKEIPLPLKM
ncbi:hypothetical protein N0U25_07410 [Pseudomonas sivasensis]|uniref:hypothetical protein n=1 Tax=Pseudomonas sivasensis TaxID=1880678 RepID=UPI0021A9D287|nr:hypothetical protein [Pseudomonas sivasensis]MCT4497616.1 hypothetical protein [Pseudomonas sivasensis]